MSTAIWSDLVTMAMCGEDLKGSKTHLDGAWLAYHLPCELGGAHCDFAGRMSCGAHCEPENGERVKEDADDRLLAWGAV